MKVFGEEMSVYENGLSLLQDKPFFLFIWKMDGDYVRIRLGFLYGYKEILKFTPFGNTEKEVADVLLNFGDVIIAIQLKWRNDKNISEDEEKR